MKLSINLNKIALIRNSRGSISPNLEYFARTALEENILGLTAHPRPDNRHIRYEDLELIKKLTDEYYGGYSFFRDNNQFAIRNRNTLR